MRLIIWDINEEKQKNKKNSEKILKNFSDVEGLKEVLVCVQALMDSDIYENIYEASNLGEEIGDFSPPSIEYLLERYRQDRYSSKILKNPSLNLFTDNIIFSHYIAITNMIEIINYVYKKFKLSLRDLDKQHAVLEKLMSLLSNFDRPVDFQPPDEEFYKKLKSIEWDKEGKKLHKKIYDILYHLNDVRFEGSATFSNGEYFAMTFLAACSAVKHNRDKILPEDVVMGYKTFLKLLNTDITKLG